MSWDPRTEIFSVEEFWALLEWAEEGLLTNVGDSSEETRALYRRLSHVLETHRSDLLK
jgi:hypothetical protein